MPLHQNPNMREAGLRHILLSGNLFSPNAYSFFMNN
jgi:hypothetical protein